MSRTGRGKKHRRQHVNKYEQEAAQLATSNPAQEIQAVLKEQQKIEVVPDSDQKKIKNPVQVYINGRWAVVDADTMDFPISIKMKIMPEWAFDCVTNRNPENRRLNEDRIAKYKRDIINNNWHVINNGIGFYTDGSNADGQHRLWAINDTQIPVTAFVVFGISKDALMAIDEGKKRTVNDKLKMTGHDTKGGVVPVTNYLLEQKHAKRKLPDHEICEFFVRHQEAARFAVDRVHKRGVGKAPVLAVIARAWYSVDRKRLECFCEILETGHYVEDSNQAAFRLREWLMASTSASNSGSWRAQCYRKAEAALVYFLQEKPMSKMYGVKDEQFLLPEEEE